MRWFEMHWSVTHWCLFAVGMIAIGFLGTFGLFLVAGAFRALGGDF
jgi:hypothetical protein